MRRTQFERVRSGLGAGVLVVGLFFQMLPFFLLLVVFAHTLGVTGGGMLVIIPALLLAMMLAACWLASKRTSKRLPKYPWPVPDRRPSWARRTAKRRRKDPVALLKTRAERYQDLKDILSGGWR